MHPAPPDIASAHGAPWVRDDRNSLFLAAMMWILIVLMIVPEGMDYESLISNGSPNSGSFISRSLWLGLLGLSIAIIFWRGRLAWVLAQRLNPFLLLFVALAVASVAWSIDPALSLRRLVRMGTIVLACIAFVLMAWHVRRFQNVVRPLLTMVMLGSIAFGLAYPHLAIHQQTSSELLGAWRGLATHKNGLGALSCLTLIFWLHAWLAREVRWLPALAGMGAGAACLLLSRSTTSLATAAFVAVFMVASMRPPQALRAFVPFLVVTLVALLMLYALSILDLVPGIGTLMTPVTAFTDKNITFTGRTEIWSIISDHIRLHPYFGTGYGAYWTATPTAGTDSYVFIERMGTFYPGSAHNGYLEIANDLGWAGLACLIGYIITHVRQSLRLLARERQQSILYLAVFFQQAITNLSETHWFSVLSVDFVLMTLASTALARSLVEHRLRQALGSPPAAAGMNFHGAARRPAPSGFAA
jgi:O-antigen ligase